MDATLRTHHLRHIVAVLDDEFGASVDAATIRGAAASAFDEICDGARIDAFIPILALRRARACLTMLRTAVADRELLADHRAPG